MMKQKNGRNIFFFISLLVWFLLVHIVSAQAVSETQMTGVPDSEFSGSWTLLNANPGWSARGESSAVVLPDNNIILTGGGWEYAGIVHDVWRSEDSGFTWDMVTSAAPWPARSHHTTVVMPDGSIVLMGGWNGNSKVFMNDVWRSTDKGVTWTCMAQHADWSPRFGQTGVVLPDGSIVLMGGTSATGRNSDVWRSTDNGATWKLLTNNPGWTARYAHTSVVTQDGSIVLMGGNDVHGLIADVWISTDTGMTWTCINPDPGWSGRNHPSAVVLPDSSIILMGGYDGSLKNDIWQSGDNGATWTRITTAAGWQKRYGQVSVLMPDGSIVLMGGVIGSATGTPSNYKNDVWRFVPAESMLRNHSSGIVVTKTISPSSIKQGTDAKITVTVFNRGPGPVHDVEILDASLPEFPVLDGEMQYSASLIEPNDTRTLVYTVHATKPGSFRFNKTKVMYADQAGNYYYTYSGYEKVEVLAPLIASTSQNGTGDFIKDIFAWFNGLGHAT
jgi:hypothetical protein